MSRSYLRPDGFKARVMILGDAGAAGAILPDELMTEQEVKR